MKGSTRNMRGEAYSLEDFRARYGLSEDEARQLLERFGPSQIDLDLLMAAKGRKPVEKAVRDA